MRQAIGHLAQADDERLDAVQHGVEDLREPRQFVALALHRDALVQRAGGDHSRGWRVGLSSRVTVRARRSMWRSATVMPEGSGVFVARRIRAWMRASSSEKANGLVR